MEILSIVNFPFKRLLCTDRKYGLPFRGEVGPILPLVWVSVEMLREGLINLEDVGAV